MSTTETADVDHCPQCNESANANGPLPGQGATRPRCGARATTRVRSSGADEQPWWVSTAPATEVAETPPHAPPQIAPQETDELVLDPPKFEMPAPASPPPKPALIPAVRVAPPKDETPESGSDEEELYHASFFSRLYVQLKRLDAATLLAFFFGSMALFLDSIESVSFLTKSLSAGGLALGFLGGVVPALVRRRNPALPIVMSSLCLFDVLFVGTWPVSPIPPPPDVAIPLRQGGLAAAQPISDDEWVNASGNAVQRHDVRVRITHVRTGSIELKELKKPGAKPFPSREKYLAIYLEVTYETKVFQSLNYESWADQAERPSKQPPTLTDNLERVYAQKTIAPRWEVVGREDKSFITPCGPVPEVLLFPLPPARLEYLRLKLPASAFGGGGEFRFQIPRSMIEQS